MGTKWEARGRASDSALGHTTSSQKRANELAATMAKPMLLQAGFKAMRERLHMPPALPNEEESFNKEP